MSSDSGEEVSVDMRKVHTDPWNNMMIMKLTEAVKEQFSSSSVYYQPFNEVVIDWETVGESVGMEAEKCHTKWTSMLQWVRTFRTMPEIILDMQTQYSKKDVRRANISFRTGIQSKNKVAPASEPKKPKVKKNPDHPKRPGANGYTIYCSEVMPQLTGIKGINKFLKIGEMWKDVADSKKAEYNERSAKQKLKYFEDVKEYAENHPEDQKIQEILADLNKVSRKRTKSPEKKNVKNENGDASNLTNSESELDSSTLQTPKKKLKFSSTKTSSKKANKKRRTGESVYVDMKLENYQEEHPERDVDYLVEKLKRKFAKLSDVKKEKYEDMAMEDE